MDDYFAEAEPNYYHDYFFSLGLLSFEHIEEIPYIVDELGITSFKWYKNYKDVAPEKFGTDSEMHDDWADAFIQALAEQEASTTLGPPENMEITSALGDSPYLDSAVDEDQEYRDYDVLVGQFPDYAETQSMTASGSLARQHGYDASFYAVHVSAGRTADELAMLHDAGWKITGETCTHYLTLTAEECDERQRQSAGTVESGPRNAVRSESPTEPSPVLALITARTCATTKSARTYPTAFPASPRRRRCSH